MAWDTRDNEGAGGLFPSQHLHERCEAARSRFADLLEREIGSL